METAVGELPGKHLKSTNYWKAYTGHGNGDNSSGFTGLPAGYRNATGSLEAFSLFGFWWSSSFTSGGSSAWRRDLYYNSASVGLNPSPSEHGYAVRCLWRP